MTRYTQCPECGDPATTRQVAFFMSTTGPVEHVSVDCVRRHHFVMPSEGLVS